MESTSFNHRYDDHLLLAMYIYIYIDGFMNEFTISILCVYIDIISPVRYGTWNAIADITLWIMDYGLWTEE